jgi:hypothetical protein
VSEKQLGPQLAAESAGRWVERWVESLGAPTVVLMAVWLAALRDTQWAARTALYWVTQMVPLTAEQLELV